MLARWQSSIVDDAGNVLPAAQVTVRREIGGAPLAVLYSDRDGLVPMGNPFPADGDGFAAFHAAGGAYRIDVTAAGFSRTLRYVGIGLQQESDAVLLDVSYLFAEEIGDADPGAGFFRFNNASPASATQIYFDNLDDAGADLSAWLNRLDDFGSSTDRGVLIIRVLDGSAEFVGRVTGSVVDGTGYRKVSVTPLAVAGSFAAGGRVGINFVPRGADGVDGDVVTSGSVSAGQIAVFADGTGAVIAGAVDDDSPPNPLTKSTIGAGKQSIWVPAAAMVPRSGTATGQMDIVNANGSRVGYLVCPASGISGGGFQIAMPKGWDEGSLTARVFWKHPATATNFATVWEVSALSLGNGDAMTSGTFGGVSVTDTGGSTDTLYVSDETTAINPGNTEVELDYLAFHVFRLGDAGGDTLAVDAHLLGVMIHYTTNANTDD